jgi:hypothetical protein
MVPDALFRPVTLCLVLDGMKKILHSMLVQSEWFFKYKNLNFGLIFPTERELNRLCTDFNRDAPDVKNRQISD